MSRIALSGNPSGSGTLTIASPNTNSDVTINLPTVTGGNFIVSNASGNVGIGTSSPAAKLDVSEGAISTTIASKTAQFNAAGGSIYSSFNDGTKEWRVGAGIQSAGLFSVRNQTDGIAPIDINSAGTLILNQGQIQFPATQNPSSNANTLDDYEEGTWTPVVRFGGNSAGQTYTSQTGRYVKIGRNVYVSCYVYMSNIGTSTGNLDVTGLPFSSEATGGGGNDYYIPIGMRGAFSLSSSSLPFSYFPPNTTRVEFYQTSTANGTPNVLGKANANNLFEFNLNFWYVSAS
jgi:hypothetical protein